MIRTRSSKGHFHLHQNAFVRSATRFSSSLLEESPFSIQCNGGSGFEEWLSFCFVPRRQRLRRDDRAYRRSLNPRTSPWRVCCVFLPSNAVKQSVSAAQLKHLSSVFQDLHSCQVERLILFRYPLSSLLQTDDSIDGRKADALSTLIRLPSFASLIDLNLTSCITSSC